MPDRFSGVLSRLEAAEFPAGADKTMPMDAAVERFIHPGMNIHVGVTHVFPYAACFEIARRFWKKSPGFTVCSLGALNHIVIWLHGGMVGTLITSYCGDVYPAPGPNPVFNEQWLSGALKIENWSVLSYTQRMLAGALGWPCCPTRSISGSSMESENAAHMSVVDDPVHGRVVLLSPLNPDISIYHAWAADSFGNAIFAPPYGENLWGAMASKGGAIITAERIVDTAFIRRNSGFARLPGQYVKAVVHAPMGGHPGGFFPGGVEGADGYAEDYDFIVEFRRANRKPDLMGPWLEKWVLGARGHAEYLERLGGERIGRLKARSSPDSWRNELEELSPGVSSSPDWTPAEFMTIAAAREIAARVVSGGFEMILAGQGNANLAAWMARHALAAQGRRCDLAAETGFFGYAPRPGNPFLFNFANIPSCTMLTDALQAL
ncbi:MAG: CoA-transferase, partial [Myxococcota bacterium]